MQQTQDYSHYTQWGNTQSIKQTGSNNLSKLFQYSNLGLQGKNITRPLPLFLMKRPKLPLVNNQSPSKQRGYSGYSVANLNPRALENSEFSYGPTKTRPLHHHMWPQHERIIQNGLGQQKAPSSYSKCFTLVRLDHDKHYATINILQIHALFSSYTSPKHQKLSLYQRKLLPFTASSIKYFWVIHTPHQKCISDEKPRVWSFSLCWLSFCATPMLRRRGCCRRILPVQINLRRTRHHMRGRSWPWHVGSSAWHQDLVLEVQATSYSSKFLKDMRAARRYLVYLFIYCIDRMHVLCMNNQNSLSCISKLTLDSSQTWNF